VAIWAVTSLGYRVAQNSDSGNDRHFFQATLVSLSLSAMAPPYLTADCQLVSDEGRRQLRSANSSYGDRCFAAAGLRLWNSLPVHLRQTDTNFEQFRWQLKTFFVRALRARCIVAIVKLRLLNNLSYLLSYLGLVIDAVCCSPSPLKTL